MIEHEFPEQAKMHAVSDKGYRVDLRPIEHEMLPLLRAWRNNPLIWKWCRQHTLIDHASHREWYEKICRDPTIQMFAIMDSSLVSTVGVCGLTDIDRINRRAEFSLYINPQRHCGGFGKTALKLLLNHAFMDQNLNVVWGETFDGNPARDMFIKLGMSLEGRRREFYFKGGRFIDAFLVSMTRREFDSCCKNW